jgi:hypothetical protein
MKEGGEDEGRAYSLTLISTGLMALVGLSAVADSKEYLKGDRPQQRGYSEAVITEGGRMVRLAGQTATVDDSGNHWRATWTAKLGNFLRTWIALYKKRVAGSAIWCK